MNIKLKTVAALALVCTSCTSFLDTEPISKVTESVYFSNDKQLESYVYDRYPELLDHLKACGIKTMLGTDAQTDDNIYNREEVANYIVGAGGTTVPDAGGLWDFTKIRKCNYFFDRVLPNHDAGIITGSEKDINHAIGEMYFFRAYEYFQKYQFLGDMPIATTAPKDLNIDILSEESARLPRTEVARFILSDLDKAAELMQVKSPDGLNNRLNRAAALLFKSRVALFEGSWLTNFKGTAFVPNGPGWPGTDLNSGYEFQAGGIDQEADWFFEQAMSAASEVADSYALVPENSDFSLFQDYSDEQNPYFNMFADSDLSSYSEVLVWREYDYGLGSSHSAGVSVAGGNSKYGTTKGLVESFVMRNGLPIYADGSGYNGDDTNNDVVVDRDTRLQLFLKVPGQYNKMFNPYVSLDTPIYEPYPTLFHASFDYQTGYALRKFGLFDGAEYKPNQCNTGCPLFRATEAYLNYIEACYEKTGAIDAKADGYWKALRNRVGVEPDYNKTIAATQMEIEAKGDWGAYTAGKLVDATRYNIRRERRNELMREGFRMADLRRWRSMDQMIDTPCILQGFKLWNSTMTSWYDDEDGKSTLVPCGESNANVSSPDDGDYLCPFRINKNHAHFDGYRWTMAHYLSPIAAKHFMLTGGDNSTIYQNPGWGTTGGDIAKSIN